MITITEVNEITAIKLEEQVSKYRNKLMAQREKLEDRRNDNRKLGLEARRKAEQELPTVLQSITIKIKNAVRRGGRSIEYSTSQGYDQLTSIFLLSLLVDVLTTEGFVCIPIYYSSNLKISW